MRCQWTHIILPSADRLKIAIILAEEFIAIDDGGVSTAQYAENFSEWLTSLSV
jgi:hypothetical protein